jgi:hypothetical protein
MAEMVRMGVLAALSDSPSLGRSTATYQAVDSAGNTFEYKVTEDASVVLDLTHFVDLDDGRRVSVGDITLALGDNLTSAELREEIRETIFEDNLRDIDEDEPRWEELIEVLGKAGIDADADTLEALPFVIELDDDVARRVTR